MDIRIEKTKNAIAKTFWKLRRQKELEKITVKELCEQAQINKSTFYSHYQDLYALAEEQEQQLADNIIQGLPEDLNLLRDLKRLSQKLFELYNQHEEEIQILFSGSRYERLLPCIEKSLEAYIRKLAADWLDDPVNYMLMVYRIHGGFYTFRKCRKQFGDEMTIDVIGRVSSRIFPDDQSFN